MVAPPAVVVPCSCGGRTDDDDGHSRGGTGRADARELPPGPGQVVRVVLIPGRYYSETVKPCSEPYLMLASCQLFSPSSRGVSET